MLWVKNKVFAWSVSLYAHSPYFDPPNHFSSPITLLHFALPTITHSCLAIHQKCQVYFNLRIFPLSVTSACNATLPTPPSPYLLVPLLSSSLYSIVTYSVRPFLDIQYKTVTLPSTSLSPSPAFYFSKYLTLFNILYNLLVFFISWRQGFLSSFSSPYDKNCSSFLSFLFIYSFTRTFSEHLICDSMLLGSQTTK